jgi:hypothetical protein
MRTEGIFVAKPLSAVPILGELYVTGGLNSLAAIFNREQHQPRGTIRLDLAEPRPSVTSPSAVTIPPDASMIASIVSRVMFCSPLRIREIEASLIGGSHAAPNSAAVGDPGSFRY